MDVVIIILFSILIIAIISFCIKCIYDGLNLLKEPAVNLKRGDVILYKGIDPFGNVEWEYETVIDVKQNFNGETYYKYYKSNITGVPNIEYPRVETDKFYKTLYVKSNHIEDECIQIS